MVRTVLKRSLTSSHNPCFKQRTKENIIVYQLKNDRDMKASTILHRNMYVILLISGRPGISNNGNSYAVHYETICNVSKQIRCEQYRQNFCMKTTFGPSIRQSHMRTYKRNMIMFPSFSANIVPLAIFRTVEKWFLM